MNTPAASTPPDATDHSANAMAQGKMDLVENPGEYAMGHLIFETGVEFIAKTEKPPIAEKRDTIGFTIMPEMAHYFEADSGLRA